MPVRAPEVTALPAARRWAAGVRRPGPDVQGEGQLHVAGRGDSEQRDGGSHSGARCLPGRSYPAIVLGQGDTSDDRCTPVAGRVSPDRPSWAQWRMAAWDAWATLQCDD